MSTLKLGPILGYESALERSEACYTCIIVTTGAKPVWIVDGQRVPFTKLEECYEEGTAWRAEWPVPEERAKSRTVAYSVEAGGAKATSASGIAAWSFYLPARTELPRFVYASCNGFSSVKLMVTTAEPQKMWERMEKDHKKEPLSLLVLGGDQIYADAIWEQPWIRDFAAATDDEMRNAPVTKEMEQNLDAFYERLYFRQWNATTVAAMLASIPSIMMWDDHDIFDGWGSHPEKLQNSKVYARIFKSALRCFKLFQLRGNQGRGFLEPKGKHFAYSVTLNDETILMLDHRTERTLTVVMSEGQWAAFKAWLARYESPRLFIQSAVPVVYRTFALVDRLLAATDKRDELEDDLNDHWTAREHQQERLRLVYSLVERQKALWEKREAERQQASKGQEGLPEPFVPQWLFLSGDVHVGCMGSVWEKELNLGLYQVVSSGITHPPPTFFAWTAICAMSGDGDDRLGNGDLVTEIHPIAGARSKFIRSRNYARIQPDKGKVWINWRCENEDDTVFAI